MGHKNWYLNSTKFTTYIKKNQNNNTRKDNDEVLCKLKNQIQLQVLSYKPRRGKALKNTLSPNRWGEKSSSATSPQNPATGQDGRNVHKSYKKLFKKRCENYFTGKILNPWIKARSLAYGISTCYTGQREIFFNQKGVVSDGFSMNSEFYCKQTGARIVALNNR